MTFALVARFPDDAPVRVDGWNAAQLRRRLEMAAEDGDRRTADLMRRLLWARGEDAPEPRELSETPTHRGRGDDDRRGQRDSRPPHSGAVSTNGAARVGGAAGAQLTGPCQNGQSQAPACEQHPGGAHGAAGSPSHGPRARNADPATAQAASELAGVPYQSASKRVHELRDEDGLLERTGETRLTACNRPADVRRARCRGYRCAGRNGGGVIRALALVLVAAVAWAILCSRAGVDGFAFAFGIVLFDVAAIAVVAANAGPSTTTAARAARPMSQDHGAGRDRYTA